jgi:hypothetical protein
LLYSVNAAIFNVPEYSMHTFSSYDREFAWKPEPFRHPVSLPVAAQFSNLSTDRAKEKVEVLLTRSYPKT